MTGRGIGGFSADPSIEPNPGDTIVTSMDRKQISTVIISEETQLESLVGDSKLTTCPNYLSDDECRTLSGEVLASTESGKMRQYGRKGGTYKEPRLHILLGSNASEDMGYSYKDVHMAAHSYDMIPGIEPLAQKVAKNWVRINESSE